MAKIPQELIKKPGREPGFVGDIIDFLYGDQKFIDPSDLVAPVGMARIGKSGNKFIDLFVGKEGRIHDIDPLGNRSGTHSKFVKEKFGQELRHFLESGGVRGSEAGLEFAVDEAGKPLPGKQTIDRSIQTLMRAYNEKGFPGLDQEVMIDKILPNGKRQSSLVSMEDLLRFRFR